MEKESVTRAAEAPDFVIDEVHGALLNTNVNALSAYLRQREIARRNSTLSDRIEILEASLGELRELLIKALNK